MALQPFYYEVTIATDILSDIFVSPDKGSYPPIDSHFWASAKSYETAIGSISDDWIWERKWNSNSKDDKEQDRGDQKEEDTFLYNLLSLGQKFPTYSESRGIKSGL